MCSLKGHSCTHVCTHTQSTGTCSHIWACPRTIAHTCTHACTRRARERCQMGAQSLPEPSPVINVDAVMAPGAALSPCRAAFLAPEAGVWEKHDSLSRNIGSWRAEPAKPKRTAALFGAVAGRRPQCALSSRAPCKPAPRGSEVPGACTPFPPIRLLPAPSGSRPGVGGCWPRGPGGHFRGGHGPSPAPSPCQAAGCPPCPQPTQNWD